MLHSTHLKVKPAVGHSSVELAGPENIRLAQLTCFLNRDRLEGMPGIFSQGRTVGFLQVRIHQMANRLRAAGFPSRILVHCASAQKIAMSGRLASIGYDCKEALDLLVGHRNHISGRIEKLLVPPEAACCELQRLHEDSPPRTIAELQALQQAQGIVPIPGWILRGLDGVTSTTILVDYGGAVRGGICMQSIFVGDEPSSMGFAFCIDGALVGTGLGTWLNARATHDALGRGATTVMEITAKEGSASRRVNEKCGLTDDPRSCVIFAEIKQVQTHERTDQP